MVSPCCRGLWGERKVRGVSAARCRADDVTEGRQHRRSCLLWGGADLRHQRSGNSKVGPFHSDCGGQGKGGEGDTPVLIERRTVVVGTRGLVRFVSVGRRLMIQK